MRVIWIILDSVGAGALPDAKTFGDEGADTLGHIVEAYPDINIPHLRKLGLGNIDGIDSISPVQNPAGMYGKAMELSLGKDTITGHWEMTGIHTKVPFKVYMNGFSQDIISEFIEKTGCGGVLCNEVASGTEVIKRFGEEHYKTGYPIVYTSADSVFQIAASIEVTGLDKLYSWCQIAREMLQGDKSVARVIARPFIRKADDSTGGYEYIRTSDRRDYAILPDEENVLVYLKEAGVPVYAVGKIGDIFSEVGISKSVHTKDNMDGVDKTLLAMDEVESGLIFTNLVEFDSVYGHRRNVKGYKECLEEFDRRIPEIVKKMKDDDILIINSDHGCDPSFKGTDHTREYIPILVFGEQIEAGKNIGVRDTFGDIGASIARVFGVKRPRIGKNFI